MEDIGQQQTPDSPRTRLAMLSQMKGYLENFKGSLESLRDEK